MTSTPVNAGLRADVERFNLVQLVREGVELYLNQRLFHVHVHIFRKLQFQVQLEKCNA